MIFVVPQLAVTAETTISFSRFWWGIIELIEVQRLFLAIFQFSYI